VVLLSIIILDILIDREPKKIGKGIMEILEVLYTIIILDILNMENQRK
jgi:hypothetical protein